ncbi:MAG: IS91 family transposase [Giesbergeria sp.]
MITLSEVIERFAPDYLAQHHPSPEQHGALAAFKRCRTQLAARMVAQCDNTHCQAQRVMPHSCGHRLCPHCQHFESQRWIERQTRQLVDGPYFLITFTLPAQLRALARAQPRIVYAALMDCAWQTLRTFSQNHRQLQGIPGAVAVLHTHNRALGYHPHVHLAMPAAALDADKRLWRRWRQDQGYLFNHKALAKVFRGKLLDQLRLQGLGLPVATPERWVVDCKRLGHGAGILAYLGRYLYRGVIQERDILRCDDTGVTYRWRDSKTKQFQQRTVPGATFLAMVLQHVLPKGFRRARNYGFLHPNSKRLITLLRWLVFKPVAPPAAAQRATLRCTCCGAAMHIVARRVPPARAPSDTPGRTGPGAPPSPPRASAGAPA